MLGKLVPTSLTSRYGGGPVLQRRVIKEYNGNCRVEVNLLCVEVRSVITRLKEFKVLLVEENKKLQPKNSKHFHFSKTTSVLDLAREINKTFFSSSLFSFSTSPFIMWMEREQDEDEDEDEEEEEDEEPENDIEKTGGETQKRRKIEEGQWVGTRPKQAQRTQVQPPQALLQLPGRTFVHLDNKRKTLSDYYLCTSVVRIYAFKPEKSVKTITCGIVTEEAEGKDREQKKRKREDGDTSSLRPTLSPSSSLSSALILEPSSYGFSGLQNLGTYIIC